MRDRPFSWPAILSLILLISLPVGTTNGQTVRISELCAASSERLLTWDNEYKARLGVGPNWYEKDFPASSWREGHIPIGWGYDGLTTDLSSAPSANCVSLYLRTTFTADASAVSSTTPLQIDVDYDDGFVAYLNGREVIRKNAGGTGALVFCDQLAFNEHASSGPVTYTLEAAEALLVEEDNLLAIQVHTHGTSDGTLFLNAVLHLPGVGDLVGASHAWSYQLGLYEPSGGIVDSALGVAPPEHLVTWGLPSFDDSAWLLGRGGIGFGDGDDATDIATDVVDRATSVYMRQAFTVDEATASSAETLVLSVDYDDGFVAYVNGREIARRGLGQAGDFTPYDATAAAHEASGPDSIDLGSAENWLGLGVNVLAVQVHNVSLSSSDMTLIADLELTGTPSALLVDHSEFWRYFIGTAEPCRPPEPFVADDDWTEFCDWIELANEGSSPVSLAGWGLRNDLGDITPWVFPDVEILPGDHLVVLCTGLDITAPEGNYLHTDFSLDRDGEYLGLIAPDGTTVSEIRPAYPKQGYHRTFGWDAARQTFAYLQIASPGASNTGITFATIPAPPAFSPDAGMYDTTLSVTMTTTDPGAMVYYTLDGSLPTPVNGVLYADPVILDAPASIRAVSVSTDGAVSEVVTASFLVKLPASLRTLPAVCLTADWNTSMHKPHGVTAIVGGTWINQVWEPDGPDDYNIPTKRGRPYERAASLEVITPEGNAPYQANCGIRIAGSNYTRPRYVLQDLEGQWNGNTTSKKAQFNVYFRGVYGPSRFEAPLFPLANIREHRSIRLRGGRNDFRDPFIRDELARRIFQDMGQVSSTGDLANLFVNGVFRGYYNPCERYDEVFFQQSDETETDWDIITHGGVTEGDDAAFQALQATAKALDMSIYENYQQVLALLDVENLIDYLVLNSYAGTWDWPRNNWCAARERSTRARLRYHVWDAEGAWGGGGIFRDPTSYNTLTNDLINQSSYLAVTFTSLLASDVFRQHWRDRAWKHLAPGGALSVEHLTQRMNELAIALNPVMQYVWGHDVTTSRMLNWIHQRRPVLIEQYRAHDLWCDVRPPDIVPPGGDLLGPVTVTLANPNGSGQVLYALDGADPRAPGGAINGETYTGPLTINQTRHIKARVYDQGEWGALAEATFLAELPPLMISEVMYHPVEPPIGSPFESEDFEFVEIYNSGLTDLPIGPLTLAEGVTFDFSSSGDTHLPAGGYILLVRNLEAFASRYPTNGMVIVGEYQEKLSNNAEDLVLHHTFFGRLHEMDYEDDWYPHTDGGGFSLTRRDLTDTAADAGKKGAWMPSSVWGGSPGGPDPGGVPPPGAVRINEVLSHTDLSPEGDWIELHNLTEEPLDLAGWTLSDSPTNLVKYVMPESTVLPAGGYVVLNARNHFDSGSALEPFAFSEHGDEVVLTSGLDNQGRLTGYREEVDLEASEREESWGCHTRSDGEVDWTPLSITTPGAANAYPRVGPVVISELMYHPVVDEGEYIELYNLSGQFIPLYDPAEPEGTWRLVDTVEYQFPEGVSLPPYSSLLVVPIDPAVFRAAHGLSEATPVYGPYSSLLGNDGSTLSLYRPGNRDEQGLPWILVDRVRYDDSPPWPEEADGAGPSLERVPALGFGSDPSSWIAGSPGGSPEWNPLVDSDQDGLPDRFEADHGLQALWLGDAWQDSDLDGFSNWAEYIAGTPLREPSDLLELRIWVSGTGPAVSFQSVVPAGVGYEQTRRLYTLEAKRDMTSDFDEVGDFAEIEANGLSITFSNAVPGSSSLYRVKVRLDIP